MLEEYDIDRLNPRLNPYAKEMTKLDTIKISPSVTEYFKEQEAKLNIPYKTLISMYLNECVRNKRELQLAQK